MERCQTSTSKYALGENALTIDGNDQIDVHLHVRRLSKVHFRYNVMVLIKPLIHDERVISAHNIIVE